MSNAVERIAKAIIDAQKLLEKRINPEDLKEALKRRPKTTVKFTLSPNGITAETPEVLQVTDKGVWPPARLKDTEELTQADWERVITHPNFHMLVPWVQESLLRGVELGRREFTGDKLCSRFEPYIRNNTLRNINESFKKILGLPFMLVCVNALERKGHQAQKCPRKAEDTLLHFLKHKPKTPA